MNCPLCGKGYPCVHSASSSALAGREEGHSEPVLAAELRGSIAPDQAWRQEVASRVQQHRARRRRHSDHNALELDFSAHEPFSFSAGSQEPSPPPERYAEIMVKSEAPKIIRFPRPAPVPMPAMQEITLEELGLAMPIPEAPRIVEADVEAEPAGDFAAAPAMKEARQMDLLPSFADIGLEPAQPRLEEELEVIPQPAPLSQRMVAGVVDGGIVSCATGICALTFLKLAEEVPQSRLTLAFGMAACGIFWLVFQYLFLLYAGTTPGMRISQLELCNFEGNRATPFARKCRALASALSGFSAGLGYAWAFIDEDGLGWHDRISQTHLRPSGNRVIG
jgi:uncharacterized RDD family membrane protein YckC